MIYGVQCELNDDLVAVLWYVDVGVTTSAKDGWSRLRLGPDKIMVFKGSFICDL